MVYSQSQISNLKIKIIRKIDKEIKLSIENGTLNEVLNKYNIELDEVEYLTCITKRSKILVLGQLSGKVKDYQIAAKKLYISEDNLEFVDYNESKHFNVERLRNSCEYSDIICGPMPHKIKGMGKTSNFIAEMEKNPTEYPKLIKVSSNNNLKFSISEFKKCIEKTRFFDEII